MLILYPDTNALHADPFMRRPLSEKLLAALLAEHVEVALSPVVSAEITRQVQEAAEGVASDIRGTIRDLDRTYGIAAAELTPAMAPFIERIEGMARRPLGPLLAHPACYELQWPRVESEELVTRELERRLPTKLRNGQTVGLRDTMIWHGLVDLLESIEDRDEVLFVTNDGGFVEGGDLAPSLAKELEDHGLDPDQVRVVSRLETAIVLAEERREFLTRQEGSARQAVIDHLAAFYGRTWDSALRSEAPLGVPIQEAVVVAVDEITIEETTGLPVSNITASALVTLSGHMRTDEFVQEYSDEAEWTQGSMDEPMIGVDYTGKLWVDVEIGFTDDGQEAYVTEEALTWT